jgi:hypothetical protein
MELTEKENKGKKLKNRTFFRPHPYINMGFHIQQISEVKV